MLQEDPSVVERSDKRVSLPPPERVRLPRVVMTSPSGKEKITGVRRVLTMLKKVFDTEVEVNPIVVFPDSDKNSTVPLL